MDRFLVSHPPHIHVKRSTASLMRDVIIALLPATVVAVVFYGWSLLLVLAVFLISLNHSGTMSSGILIASTAIIVIVVVGVIATLIERVKELRRGSGERM